MVRNTSHVTMELLHDHCIQKLLLRALGVADNDHEREWIHNCLGAGDDLELLMDTKTIRDIYQLMTSRPWIFGNFEWNQLSYFRNLEISTTTMLEQVDVELEAAGPELDVLGCTILCPITEEGVVCLICHNDMAGKDNDCVRTVACGHIFHKGCLRT